MKRELLIRRLVNALRHRRFRRTRFKSKNGQFFCATGYACEIYRRHQKTGEWGWSDSSGDQTFSNTGEVSRLIGERLWLTIMLTNDTAGSTNSQVISAILSHPSVSNSCP